MFPIVILPSFMQNLITNLFSNEHFYLQEIWIEKKTFTDRLILTLWMLGAHKVNKHYLPGFSHYWFQPFRLCSDILQLHNKFTELLSGQSLYRDFKSPTKQITVTPFVGSIQELKVLSSFLWILDQLSVLKFWRVSQMTTYFPINRTAVNTFRTQIGVLTKFAFHNGLNPNKKKWETIEFYSNSPVYHHFAD